ncbi:unnamed protein product [Auanema sp. JU1783]|nr:unnamed protein product [Auanema sp. JU1783]
MEDLTEFLCAQFSSAKDFSDAWIANTIDGNFSDFEATSSAVTPDFFLNDTSDQVDVYKNLISLLRVLEESSTGTGVWEKMNDVGISGKRMMLVFWYSMEKALQRDSQGMEVKAGIAAASCYHTMCCLQGAQAYHIFNPYLYEKCLELFRTVYREITYDSRSINTKTKTKTKGKGKQKRKDDDDLPEEESKMNLEKSELHELLEQATLSLYLLFNKVALSAYKEVSETTALFVRDIAQLDASKETRTEPCENARQFSKLPYISDRAFALMHRLVQDKHSTDGVLVYSRIVFPRLAYWGFDLNIVTSSAIPAIFTMWKDLMFRFVVYRMKHGEKQEMRSIVKIIDNLFCRCTDRQDYRTKLSQCVVQILLELPRKEQYDFICRLNVFSQNVKTSLRNFTVEVVPHILVSLDLNELKDIPDEAAESSIQAEVTIASTRDEDEDSDDDNRLARKLALEKKRKAKLNKKKGFERVDASNALYECLLRCCLDKSPSVRGKAIVYVSNLLKDPVHGQHLRRISQSMYDKNPGFITGKHTGTGEDDGKKNDSINEEDFLDDSFEEVTNVLFFIIKKAMSDEKAAVRKSGIIAMQSYFGMLDNAVEFELALTLLKNSVVDASVLVRRQSAETINFILRSKPVYRNHLEILWLKTVLPLINDREQSVVSVAAKLISDTIFSPLLNGDELVWSLLKKIEQEDNHRRLLVRTMFTQASEGKLTENIINVLQKNLVKSPENIDVIWMMLAELSVVFRSSNVKISPSKAIERWFELTDDDDGNKVRYIAKVLSSSDESLDSSQKYSLIDDMKRKLSNYELEAAHISSVYLCMARLMGAVGEDAKNGNVLRDFGVRLLNDCKRQLRKHLDEFSSEIHMNDGESLSSMESKLIRVITTIGEVIQFSPTLLTLCDELVNALKVIMASADIQADEEICFKIINSAVPSVNPTPLPSRAGTALGQYAEPQSEVFSQPTSVGSLPMSQGQAIIPPHLINRKGHFVGVQLFTPLVRSYCVLAIGKFCLMDEKLAKSCVPVLVRQLKVNPDHIIRNNVVFVICDLCIRYTLLVDRYSPIIASCLKDRSTLVRHHTLESLTNLIKEQFIRWEGQIMYRFVSTILDENRAIREYAEFCLKDVLLLQFPGMFYNHFIECLIYFNEVSRKYMPGAMEDLDVDTSLKFSLGGKRNFKARMILYKFMIATFDDKQKFMTMSHICEQIFRPICSGELDFKSKHVQDLLTDAFEIMSSKEIRLNMDVGKGNDEDEDEPSPDIVAAAKNMISSAFRKGFILSIMPPLLEMRSFLLENQSNQIKLCFAVLRAICREHQEQIDEFLAGDKQLKAEIEFDIKKYERYEIYQRNKAKEAAQAAKRERRSMVTAAVLIRAREQSNPDNKSSMEVLEEDATDRECTPLRKDSAVNMEVAGENNEKSPSEESQPEKTSENNESVADMPTRSRKLSKVQNMDVDLPKENVNCDNELGDSRNVEVPSSSTVMQGKENKTGSDDIAEKTSKGSDATFAVPTGGRLSQRKRTRLSESNPMSEEAILGRAISTPNKTMDPNLTFADLNLSAIRSDNEVKPPRSSTRLRRTTLDRINE